LVWEGRDFSIVIGPLVVVWSLGEVVSFVCYSWLVFQLDVIVRQAQEVAGNASVDLLQVTPVLEVVVVHEDDYWVGASDE